MLEPCLLNFRTGIRLAHRFNRRDLRVSDTVNRCDARPRGDAVNMHGASAAQRRAATEFRAGHAEYVAQDPEQWRVAINIDTTRGSVDFDCEGHDVVSFLICRMSRTFPACSRVRSDWAK